VYTQVLYILPGNFLWVQGPFSRQSLFRGRFFPHDPEHPFPAGGPAPILSCEDGNLVAYFAVAILRIVYDDILVSTCGSARLFFLELIVTTLIYSRADIILKELFFL
jgi:hypothetical protein